MDYPHYLQSIYRRIHQELNVLIYGEYDESWHERFTNWMHNCQIYLIHVIDWKIISLSMPALIFITLVYVITAKWLKVSQSIPVNLISHDDTSSNNDDSQTSLQSTDFIRKPLEICEIVEGGMIFHSNFENYNQFYVVSLDTDDVENSSLKIDEIFDSTDDSDNNEAKTMIESRNIVDAIINSVEAKSENCQNSSQSIDINVETRAAKTNSKIPLLKSRRGQQHYDKNAEFS